MSDDPNDRGLSRKHLMASIDGSLRRLGTDYVDLYQIHRWDPETPIEETLQALHDIVRAGKARYIGASSMCAWQFAKALHLADRHGWTRFVSMQNHYNLVYREEEREMLPLCRDEGIGVIPWSPLARGFLAGNRQAADKGDDRAREDRRLRAQALLRGLRLPHRRSRRRRGEARGVTPAQIALAWILHQPGVTAPIVGASKMEHLDQAIAALDITLSEEELRQLEEPVRAASGEVVGAGAKAAEKRRPCQVPTSNSQTSNADAHGYPKALGRNSAALSPRRRFGSGLLR